MNFKEFGESADIKYIVTVVVNGERAGRIQGVTYESISEQWRKLVSQIELKLSDQFVDLPENSNMAFESEDSEEE